MFSAVYSLFQKHQPISITGVFRHASLWVSCFMDDLVYINPKSELIKKSKEKPDIAIYCIHGTADHVAAFSLIANRLISDLPQQISTINLIAFNQRFQGKGIEDFAQQLRNKIIAQGHKKIILMGHSRGGLIASYYSENLAQLDNINVLSVITIGTPFSGSEYATAPLSWISSSIKQMQKNNIFLKELSQKIRVSKNKYYYFAAELDSLVSTNSACASENSDDLITLKRHGHLSIMSSWKLVTHIRKHINEVVTRVSENTIATQSNLADEEIIAQLIDDFVDFEKQIQESLINICNEIDTEVVKLQSRYHIKSPANKIQVLTQLKALFLAILNDTKIDDKYKAETIGDFINIFLEDLSICNGIKPMTTLSEPLNFNLGVFSSNKPQSQIFIESLIKKYKHTSLPKFAHDQSFSAENMNPPSLV